VAKHDELLEQGPREAPEPETAEQRGKRLGVGGAAGGAAAAGVAAAKFGGLAKFLVFLFAWHGAVDAWRIGGWIGLAVVLAGIVTILVLRSRRQA
jgi:hypothetical protein